MNIDRKHVVVCGAGIAGLSCAVQLAILGYKVTIVEAKPQCGGRMITHFLRGSKDYVELGAAWVHGRKKNPVWLLCKKLGIKLHASNFTSDVFFAGLQQQEDESKMVEESADERKVDAKLMREVRCLWNAVSGIVETLDKEASMEDNIRLAHSKLRDLKPHLPNAVQDVARILDEPFPLDPNTVLDEPAMKLYAYMWAQLEDYNATNLSTMSADDDDDLSLGGNYDVEGGYIQLIDHLCGILSKFPEVQIVTQAVIKSVVHTDDNVTLTVCSKNKVTETIVADYAVSTFPIGVLRESIASTPGCVAFKPALSEDKQIAIRGIGSGLLDKVVLRFDRRFWKSNIGAVRCVGPTRGRCVWFYSPFEGEGDVLVAYLHAATAEYLEQLSDDDAKATVLAPLRNIYGQDVGNLVDFARTTWNADPFARGSYSHLQPGSLGLLHDLIAKPEGRIHFAGEHTCRPFNGMVHGALWSGVRAARDIYCHTESIANTEEFLFVDVVDMLASGEGGTVVPCDIPNTTYRLDRWYEDMSAHYEDWKESYLS